MLDAGTILYMHIDIQEKGQIDIMKQIANLRILSIPQHVRYIAHMDAAASSVCAFSVYVFTQHQWFVWALILLIPLIFAWPRSCWFASFRCNVLDVVGTEYFPLRVFVFWRKIVGRFSSGSIFPPFCYHCGSHCSLMLLLLLFLM